MAEIERTLTVLADASRLRLLYVLFVRQDVEWPVSELVELLELPQPTVSKQLAVLRDAGLVDVRKDGQRRRYRLADQQDRISRALLQALETFVARTPEAQEDARQAKTRLTSSGINATHRLHYDSGDRTVNDVFVALAHPARRRILDLVKTQPGATVNEVSAHFDTSRAAVMKHLATLERANLLHSERRGRERRLYHNVVPVQMIYDRWTTELTAELARHVIRIKETVEQS